MKKTFFILLITSLFFISCTHSTNSNANENQDDSQKSISELYGLNFFYPKYDWDRYGLGQYNNCSDLNILTSRTYNSLVLTRITAGQGILGTWSSFTDTDSVLPLENNPYRMNKNTHKFLLITFTEEGTVIADGKVYYFKIDSNAGEPVITIHPSKEFLYPPSSLLTSPSGSPLKISSSYLMINELSILYN